MKILLTGGTGVIGEGAIPHLLSKGHSIRLLSRRADSDSRQWPEGVEALAADIARPEELVGAAAGCDIVVHLTGIVEEKPPEITYERINVEGTRNIVKEAARASVGRFIFVSSLGAERGRSAYHQSKRRAEEIVREFSGGWVILRPGNVYGPGNNVISTLLKMVRALPVMPMIDSGNQAFQPIWHDDLGAAIARAVDATELDGSVLELAGSETTSTNDLLDRLAKITDRDPVRLPVPSFLASIGSSVAGALGVPFPINDATITMLLEENVLEQPESSALVTVFGITPTPLAVGLRILADSVPEQTPADGFGGLEQKRFWADIVGSRFSPSELLGIFRERCTDIMPIELEAEPATPQHVAKGVTLTAALPFRGNIQMRVQESSDQRITFATLEGHPLAGVVQFNSEESDGAVRFQVTIYARAAGFFDWLAMNTIGDPMQSANWETVVGRMVALSGGEAAKGVEKESTTLADAAADEVDDWICDLIIKRKRQENETAGGSRHESGNFEHHDFEQTGPNPILAP